jgi:hypothetical protein
MATDISYSSWKAFTKKQKLEGELEDKELLRVLSKFDKTDESKPAPRLEALEDVIKEIPKQVTALVKLKKKLGDKPFGLVKDELYAILEEAEKLKKKTQAALDAENDKDDEEEEDEDSAANVLLQPKLLLKQLTMCKKDPERTMKFAYIDGKSKEQPPVLAMHPKLSAKKLFAKLQIATGVKTGAFGSAWVDGTSLMLQLDKPLSGLVKKVRGPVKACGFKIAKAVLWNADGTVFEQDDEAEETVGAATAPGAGEAPGAGAAAPGADGPAKKMPADADKMAFATRLLKLRPQVDKAVSDGHAQAAKLQAQMGKAMDKAKAGDSKGGTEELQILETMLSDMATAAAEATAEAKRPPGAPDPKLAFNARLKAMFPSIQAAQAGPPPNPAIALMVKEFGALAKKGDFGDAHAVLDKIEAMLEGKQAGGKATSTSEESDDPKAREASALRASLQDDFDALQRGPLSPALREQFQPVSTGWMAAQDASNQGQHERALLILKRIADTGTLAKLRQAMGEAPADTGRLVRQRKFMLERWAKIPPELRSQLGSLRKAVTASGADDDPDGLVDAIEAELDDLVEELQDELDAAINAGSTAGLSGIRTRFEGDALVQHLRSGPGIDGNKLLKAVLDAVDEIETEMTRA